MEVVALSCQSLTFWLQCQHKVPQLLSVQFMFILDYYAVIATVRYIKFTGSTVWYKIFVFHHNGLAKLGSRGSFECGGSDLEGMGIIILHHTNHLVIEHLGNECYVEDI